MSFAADIKNELCSYEISRGERRIFLNGFLCGLKRPFYFTESGRIKDFLRKAAGEAETPFSSCSRRGKEGFLLDFSKTFRSEKFAEERSKAALIDGNDKLVGLFLRGVFLSCGSASSPEKQYHLEMALPDEKSSLEICRLITERGIKIKLGERKRKAFLYSKDSESISDFLTFIGAMQASMEIMNAKIYKSMRNKVNRTVNCESANIDKTVSAVRKQTENIDFIERTAGLGILPEDLRVIAELRRENIDLPLSEIGKLLDPPISRSGAYHRMKRIDETAERLRAAQKAEKSEE